MQFRRSGGRDERRRRVLMEESSSVEATAESSATAAGGRAPRGDSSAPTAPDYADSARASRQLRLSDLVPHSAWQVALLTGLALLAAATVVAAAWYSAAWTWLDEAARQMFMPSGPGSLANWLASVLMLLAAVGAAQIYLLRRHKTDDYRGRYRLWLWLAAALVLASADAAVGLHRLLGLALTASLPERLAPPIELAWMPPLGVLLAAAMIRLAVEVRRSYGTLVGLASAALCYAATAAAIARPDWLAPLGADSRLPAATALALQLAGHVMLLLATMTYARYVYLAANGLLPARAPRQPKQKAKRKPAAETAADQQPAGKAAASKAAPAASERPAKRSAETRSSESARADKNAAAASASKPAASSNRGDRKPQNSAPATIPLEKLAEADDLSEEDTAHLSKAERRRLRKLQRRSGRAA